MPTIQFSFSAEEEAEAVSGEDIDEEEDYDDYYDYGYYGKGIMYEPYKHVIYHKHCTSSIEKKEKA